MMMNKVVESAFSNCLEMARLGYQDALVFPQLNKEDIEFFEQEGFNVTKVFRYGGTYDWPDEEQPSLISWDHVTRPGSKAALCANLKKKFKPMGRKEFVSYRPFRSMRRY